MALVHTYLPQSAKDIKGQEKAIEQTRSFLQEFKKGKAAILYGPVGCGKTTIVHVIAKELGKEVFEINASDARNKAQVEGVVKQASMQESLLSFGKGKVILFDDADGLSGQKDRGGAAALVNIIEESRYPILLTANDPSDSKFKAIRKKAVMIECNALSYEHIVERLSEIAQKESITFTESDIRNLAMRAGGDMRGAITDFEVATTSKVLEIDMLNERDTTDVIEQGIFKVLKTTNLDIARDAFESVKEQVDEQLMWMDENVPKEYEGADITKAYDHLSRAAVFLGRIRRWQHWRFLVYAAMHIGPGVAISKKEKYKKALTYKRSQRPLQMYIAKMKYMKRQEIARKIAEKTHTSTKRAMQDILPFVQKMVQSGRSFKEFDFTEDELTWLRA